MDMQRSLSTVATKLPIAMVGRQIIHRMSDKSLCYAERSSGPHGSLDLGHVSAISLDILKQMAVQVECHVDG